MPVERARTHSEIDAEIAAWGDVPTWPGRAADGPARAVTPTEPVDPYGWLYRSGDARRARPEIASTGVVSPFARYAVEEPVDEPTGPLSVIGFGDDGPATEPFVPLGVDRPPVTTPVIPPVAPPPRPQVLPVATHPQAHVPASTTTGHHGHAGRPVRKHPVRRAVLTVVALATCVSLGAAATLLAVRLGSRTAQVTQPPVTTPATTAAAPVPGAQWSGPTAAIAGVTAEADCVAAPGRDAASKVVRYDASNLTDGAAATAWRCDADLTPSVTLTVPAGQQIAAVGLINGYAKVDPADRTNRYPLYRRVLEVRWTFPDGTTVNQKLVDKQTEMQIVQVPVCATGTVTLEVIRTTNPSSNSVTRDAVVISEITVLAPKV